MIKPEVANYLHDNADSVMWERQPIDDLARSGKDERFPPPGLLEMYGHPAR